MDWTERTVHCLTVNGIMECSKMPTAKVVRPVFGVFVALCLIPCAALAESVNGGATGSTNTANRNDAVSTGVGNAGSFGIGSGVSDSFSEGKSWGEGVAKATATSDGYESQIEAHFAGPVATQQLVASITDNSLQLDPSQPSALSGNLSLTFAGGVFGGAQSVAVNTSPFANTQAAIAMAAYIGGSVPATQPPASMPTTTPAN